jgi:hypothetical protein
MSKRNKRKKTELYVCLNTGCNNVMTDVGGNEILEAKTPKEAIDVIDNSEINDDESYALYKLVKVGDLETGIRLKD